MREEKSEAVMAAPEAAEMPAMIARVVFDMVKRNLRLKTRILEWRLPVVYEERLHEDRQSSESLLTHLRVVRRVMELFSRTCLAFTANRWQAN